MTTLTGRTRLAAPALLLALALTGCGGSSDEGSSSGSGASDSESAESSESPSPSESPAAAAEDYAALFTALFDQQGKVEDVASAEDFNRQASFPDGVSVAQFDKKTKTLCVQDEGKQISGSFDASSTGEIVLNEGLCEGGEEVSRLEPDPQDEKKLKISGDQELGRAVETVLEKQFGGS